MANLQNQTHKRHASWLVILSIGLLLGMQLLNISHHHDEGEHREFCSTCSASVTSGSDGAIASQPFILNLPTSHLYTRLTSVESKHPCGYSRYACRAPPVNSPIATNKTVI